MNKKGILFTLIILISFLVLFSFVNRWAYISSEYDEVKLAQQELVHAYYLQQNLASTYMSYLGIHSADFIQNTTHSISQLSGNISARDVSSFLSTLHTFYTEQLQKKSSVFALEDTLSSAITFEPHGYNMTLATNEVLFEWNQTDVPDSLSLVLFFNTTIDSVSDSQTSDAAINPLINITIYDQNGLYGTYQDTLDPTQNNNDMTFISEEVEYSTSFGLYSGNNGVLRLTKNETTSDLIIWDIIFVSSVIAEQTIEGFSAVYSGEYISYNGNIKLAYE